MIVVFGSLNMDLVMRVAALPRPGETVLCPGYALKPGGKGANQAVAARRAGAEVAFYGALGPDGFGESLLAVLEAEGIGTAGVARVPEPTGCATICVDDGGENLIAVASGANLSVRAAQVPDEALGPGVTLLMQREVPAAETWALLARARARGVRSVLNLAPAGEIPADALAMLDVLVVNELEAASVAEGLGLAAGGEPPDLARRLSRRAGCTVVVTLGGAGVVAAEAGGAVWRMGVLPIKPVDTTGAGDAFCGALTAALDAGADLPAALRRAGVSAGLACLDLGAQESLPRAAEVEARLAELEPPRRLS